MSNRIDFVGQTRAVCRSAGLLITEHNVGFTACDEGLLVFVLDTGEWQIRSSRHAVLMVSGRGSADLARMLSVAGRQ
ncbi:MAG TPA: hypothetical protein VGP42_06310 [Stellaceae bacterium]|jgi:hypothetical protein|nr:hypothetical protein [Stellaceae bacterium]